MNKTFVFGFLFFLSLFTFSQEKGWQALRISDMENQNKTNTWINFRKDIEIEYF